MSTIFEFRRMRNEVALTRLVSHAGEDAPSRADTPGAQEHIAEIILLPRTRRPEPKPGEARKPLKRRFALRAATARQP